MPAAAGRHPAARVHLAAGAAPAVGAAAAGGRPAGGSHGQDRRRPRRARRRGAGQVRLLHGQRAGGFHPGVQLLQRQLRLRLHGGDARANDWNAVRESGNRNICQKLG